MTSKRYSIAEARANLPKIIDQAETGVEVELTRRGKPVAVVISRRSLDRMRGDRPAFTEVYQSFLKKYSPKAIGLENDFFRSLRGTDVGRKVSL